MMRRRITLYSEIILVGGSKSFGYFWLGGEMRKVTVVANWVGFLVLFAMQGCSWLDSPSGGNSLSTSGRGQSSSPTGGQTSGTASSVGISGFANVSSYSQTIAASGYGCVGDGQTNNDQCLQQLFNACLAKCSIQFEAGNFVFNSPYSYAFTKQGDQAVSIIGRGQGTTTLTFNSGGISLTYSANTNFRNSAHFRDLSFVQSNANVGTAVSIHGTGSLQVDPTTFDNVTFQGWLLGVLLDTVSTVNFNGVTFNAGSSTNATGISLQGNPSIQSYGTQFQIANSQFLGGALGILYGQYIQGVEIINSQFGGGIKTAALVPENITGPTQLAIYNSIIDTSSYGFLIQNAIPAFLYSNNTQTVAANSTGILIQAYATDSIMNSNFFGAGDGSGSFGVYGQSSVGTNMTIAQNNFSGFNAGIYLDKATSGYFVFNNSSTGGGVTVSNLGGAANNVPLMQGAAQPAATVTTTLQTPPNPSTVGALLASNYGCVGDGKTLNDACLANMLSACSAQCTILLGSGDFLFNGPQVYLFPNDVARSLTIQGEGQGVTNLLFSGTSGIDVTYSSKMSDTTHFRDLSVTQSGKNAGTGIALHGSGGPVSPQPSTFDNVSFLAQQFVDGGWATGLLIDSVSSVNFNGLMSYYLNSQLGTGVRLQSSAGLGTNYNFVDCIFLNQNISIDYGPNISDVVIINSEFTNMQTAIQVDGGVSGNSGLKIVNSQIAAQAAGILVASPLSGFLYANNLQYVPSGVSGIYLAASTSGSVIDNDLSGPGPGNGAFGIYGAPSLSSSLVIADNRIAGFNAGIYLDKQSSGYAVTGNSYVGTGVGSKNSPSDFVNLQAPTCGFAQTLSDGVCVSFSQSCNVNGTVVGQGAFNVPGGYQSHSVAYGSTCQADSYQGTCSNSTITYSHEPAASTCSVEACVAPVSTQNYITTSLQFFQNAKQFSSVTSLAQTCYTNVQDTSLALASENWPCAASATTVFYVQTCVNDIESTLTH